MRVRRQSRTDLPGGRVTLTEANEQHEAGTTVDVAAGVLVDDESLNGPPP